MPTHNIPPQVVEKQIQLSAEHAARLHQIAQDYKTDESRLIGKALDILFNLTDLLDTQNERQGWSALSEGSLQRVWDNDEDAIYDNWRELYGIV